METYSASTHHFETPNMATMSTHPGYHRYVLEPLYFPVLKGKYPKLIPEHRDPADGCISRQLAAYLVSRLRDSLSKSSDLLKN